MTDRIKNKINEAFRKYHTDCLIGIFRSRYYNKECKAIIVNTYNNANRNIIFIGNSGINLLHYYYSDDILYVRDLQDIAYTEIFDI